MPLRNLPLLLLLALTACAHGYSTATPEQVPVDRLSHFGAGIQYDGGIATSGELDPSYEVGE